MLITVYVANDAGFNEEKKEAITRALVKGIERSNAFKHIHNTHVVWVVMDYQGPWCCQLRLVVNPTRMERLQNGEGENGESLDELSFLRKVENVIDRTLAPFQPQGTNHHQVVV